MKDSGSIVKYNDKVIYVFGKSVVPYEEAWENHSYIGINLDTDSVDDIQNNYPQYVRFEELTDHQERVLSQYIPIRQRLANGVMTVSAPARSGKDTLADYVIKHFGEKNAYKRSLGTPIKEIDKIISGHVQGKNRESLIMIGQGLRNEDPNIWIKVWLRRAINLIVMQGVDYKDNVIVPDVRQPNEFTFFKSLGALTVKIEADEENRLDKIKEIDGVKAVNEKLLKDETESHSMGFDTDYTIYNAYDDTFIEHIESLIIDALTERGW